MSIATKEIRELAIQAYLSGKGSFEKVAAMFDRHPNTIKRWVREFTESGRLEPRTRGHMAPAFSAEERKQLALYLEKHPDATLEEVKKSFVKKCSLVAIHNTIQAIGFCYKKNRYTRQSKNEKM